MDYEKEYKEAFKRAKKLYMDCVESNNPIQAARYVDIFQELKGSDVKTELLGLFKACINGEDHPYYPEDCKRWIAWLEKQGEQKSVDKIQLGKKYKCIASPRYSTFVKGFIYKPEDKFLCSLMNFFSDCFESIEDGEQKPTMIQWKGNNLREVIDFTGVYKEGFEKWFHNSWEEYEKYVHEHNNIFKIFNEDGSHIEVPVGAWIVKTPDGYNTASRYVFRQKPAWRKTMSTIMALFNIS